MRIRLTDLSGRPGGPPGDVGVDVLDRIAGLGHAVTAAAARCGAALDVDPFALLTARVAEAGWTRGGRLTCGGAGRLVRAADGWMAVSLARSDDLDALPAWLELAEVPADPWAAVEARLPTAPCAHWRELGVLLGLPVAVVGEVTASGPMIGRTRLSTARPSVGTLGGLRVVDLSSLWAGPLCAHLLGRAGASVVKVESVHRPDGARRGLPGFYRSLHDGHEERTVELRTPAGRDELRALLAGADVVIEGARPRALEQLGIDAAGLVAGGRIGAWVSITAHGRTGAGRDRVGFGDDAAAAGGLVGWDDHGPTFVGDAVADPLTGLAAAAAVLGALAAGGSWLLDASLSRVAAGVARGSRSPRR